MLFNGQDSQSEIDMMHETLHNLHAPLSREVNASSSAYKSPINIPSHSEGVLMDLNYQNPRTDNKQLPPSGRSRSGGFKPLRSRLATGTNSVTRHLWPAHDPPLPTDPLLPPLPAECEVELESVDVGKKINHLESSTRTGRRHSAPAISSVDQVADMRSALLGSTSEILKFGEKKVQKNEESCSPQNEFKHLDLLSELDSDASEIEAVEEVEPNKEVYEPEEEAEEFNAYDSDTLMHQDISSGEVILGQSVGWMGTGRLQQHEPISFLSHHRPRRRSSASTLAAILAQPILVLEDVDIDHESAANLHERRTHVEVSYASFDDARDLRRKLSKTMNRRRSLRTQEQEEVRSSAIEAFHQSNDVDNSFEEVHPSVSPGASASKLMLLNDEDDFIKDNPLLHQRDRSKYQYPPRQDLLGNWKEACQVPSSPSYEYTPQNQRRYSNEEPSKKSSEEAREEGELNWQLGPHRENENEFFGKYTERSGFSLSIDSDLDCSVDSDSKSVADNSPLIHTDNPSFVHEGNRERNVVLDIDIGHGNFAEIVVSTQCDPVVSA